MSYKIYLRDIMPQYYAYIKECMRKDMEDSQGTAAWQYDLDRDVFEDRWFNQQGIERITVDHGRADDPFKRKTIVMLEFKDEAHFTYWMLKWT